MPEGKLQLIPGVDTNKTLVQNEGAVSQSNLVRLFADRSNIGLVQKLGGWQAYYNSAIASPVRAIRGWTDLNGNSYLGIGAENDLNVIKDGTLLDITPRSYTSDNTIDFSTTSGSSIVSVVDSNLSATSFYYVNYVTPVSVGGLTLYGPYAVINAIGTTYEIDAGMKATATVANGGAIPEITVLTGQAVVTVTFEDHNLLSGEQFYIDPAITIGGLTISGTYSVYQVVDANNFTILASATATSSAGPTALNSGEVRAQFYVGLTPSTSATGYGAGGYGAGGYGTGVNPPVVFGSKITSTDWTLGSWGEILVGCTAGGAIYFWSPYTPPDNAQIVGGTCPLVNDGIFVAMPQRQIVAWGSSFGLSQDALLVRWCDTEDFSVWNATSVNQAGSYRIPSGSKIVTGLQVQQQALLWTDLELWSMSYIGPPLVYGFNQIGSNCGAISRHCVGNFGTKVFWMSQKEFFVMDGGGIQPLFCSVWDVIFQNLKQGTDANGLPYTDRIRCAVNSQFNEVSWFYPSANSNGENDSYVKFNTVLQQWDYGSLGRTAWIDQSVLGPPIGAGTDNFIYQHEIGNDAANGIQAVPMNSSFQTGYMEIQEADKLIFIDQIWPDMKWGTYSGNTNANVNITFYGVNYPSDTPTVYGPYVMTQGVNYLSTRIRNRLLSVKISSNDAGTFWRLGGIRYRYQEDGRF